MEKDRRNEQKTDPAKRGEWEFACKVCGTPFISKVEICEDCGSTEIVPADTIGDSD